MKLVEKTIFNDKFDRDQRKDKDGMSFITEGFNVLVT